MWNTRSSNLNSSKGMSAKHVTKYSSIRSRWKVAYLSAIRGRGAKLFAENKPLRKHPIEPICFLREAVSGRLREDRRQIRAEPVHDTLLQVSSNADNDSLRFSVRRDFLRRRQPIEWMAAAHKQRLNRRVTDYAAKSCLRWKRWHNRF